MHEQPYSTRFLAVHTADGWHTYRVPQGNRAVIQSVTCVVYGTTATTFQVYVGTTYVANLSLQGNTSQALVNLRTPAYGGEDIGASVTTSQGHLIVSGYLFADDPLSREPRATIKPKVEVLPVA